MHRLGGAERGHQIIDTRQRRRIDRTAERRDSNPGTQLAHDKNPDDTGGFLKPAALRRMAAGIENGERRGPRAPPDQRNAVSR
jgi:hypothetical protein